MTKPLALVAGAGSGLGQKLMERFEQEGMHAVGLVRSQPQGGETSTLHRIDLTDETASNARLADLIAEHGAPKIVVHNTAELVIASLEDTGLEAFEACWRNMVFSAAVLAKAVLPAMAASAGGTFIVSGATASMRGGAKFPAFASAKFALRGLTQALARDYQTRGVHVAHVILDGIIDTPRSRDLHSMDPARMMDPADIADVYWSLSQQPASTWTHELDLRPRSESF